MIRLDSNRSDRPVGFILLASAVLVVFSMAHHPSGMHGGALVYWVHGAMLVLLSCLFFSFCYYSLRRGLDRLLVLAALVAYGLNYFSHVIAGTINGFIVPALAERGDSVSHGIFLFAWEANQGFARLGTTATAVAFALWGMDLVRHEQGYARVLGVVGMLAGVLPLGLLLHDATMDVHTAFITYSVHALFAALLGLRLIQRKFPS